ncbi:hypothetical protein LCL95_14965 [Bacillus timonensis]|nr:hypothetical protein [Bacillus timonensis]
MERLMTKKIIQEKLDRIKKGYSAYAENGEISHLLKKEIKALGLTVHEEITDLGSWFIPENNL